MPASTAKHSAKVLHLRPKAFPAAKPEHGAPAPDSPSLSYTWERFGLIAREFPPLFKQHWAEIALNQDKVPLDPHWDRYFDFDIADILNVLTVRERGTLVGYLFVLVFPHLHYASTTWAQTDMFWLHPAYRQGRAGIRMFVEMEKHLKSRQVKVVHVVLKLHFEKERGTLAKLFTRLGYKAAETVMAKYIG